MPTLNADLALVACDDQACREAHSHEVTCRCACNGAGHRAAHRLPERTPAQRAAVLARAFRDFDPDDIPVLIQRRPIAWCAPCMTTADDCTCEA